MKDVLKASKIALKKEVVKTLLVALETTRPISIMTLRILFLIPEREMPLLHMSDLWTIVKMPP